MGIVIEGRRARCPWHTRLGLAGHECWGARTARYSSAASWFDLESVSIFKSITNAAAVSLYPQHDSYQIIMSDAHAPLTWETSTHTQPQLATTLPSEVVNCLENARYVRFPHLDACCSACADSHTSSIWQPAQSCNLMSPS